MEQRESPARLIGVEQDVAQLLERRGTLPRVVSPREIECLPEGGQRPLPVPCSPVDPAHVDVSVRLLRPIPQRSPELDGLPVEVQRQRRPSLEGVHLSEILEGHRLAWPQRLQVPRGHRSPIGRQRAVELPQLGVAPADLVVGKGDEAPVMQLAIETIGAFEQLQRLAETALSEISLAQAVVGLGLAVLRSKPLKEEQ